MSELHDAAVAYARRGWAVMPLATQDKVPAIKGGCRSASCDPTQADAWWSVNPQHNVAVATGEVSGGLVVIDIDVDEERGEDGLSTLHRWEREHGELPETVTAVTGRGGLHLYYRANEPVACSVNKDAGVDVRAEGGYAVAPPSVHPNGRRYEWQDPPDERPVARADENVYGFIRSVQEERTKKKRFELPREIGAGGRNDTLFRYASSLQAQGFDDTYIAMALSRANADRCRPPLPDGDVDKIVASATGRYEKGKPPEPERRRVFRKLDSKGYPTGPVMHDVVGQELIERHGARIIDGAPAVWDGQRYAVGWSEVDRACVGLVRDAKIADQREVRHYVSLIAPQVAASPPSLLAFANGVLDVRTMELLRPNEGHVITNVVPHDWDCSAYDATVDGFLDSVSAGSAQVRANLEEIVGMCMYRSNEFGQCPVLIGAGSNGKSTYIHGLRNVLGADNVSSLDIGVLGRPFQAGRLVGKLANLGDDISNERLSGDVLAVFKKVVTGEWVYTDVKNGEGFDFRPICTLVFSCNEFPALGDSSEGMMRRLFPVPFDARFSRTSPGYDPRLWERLCTEGAARYLVRLGVEGLQRLLEQNGLTPNPRSEELVAEVRTDNDSILQWLEEESVTGGELVGEIISEVYDRYARWCDDGRLRPFGRKKFTTKVCKRFGFESVVRKRQYSDGRRSVRVFEDVAGRSTTD